MDGVPTAQSVSATFGPDAGTDHEAGIVLESALNANFASIDKAFFALISGGDASNELDIFDFSGMVGGTDFWSMAATVSS